jgi:hypothetical protein
MLFVTWLAFPVVITLVASLIMMLLSRTPRTDMHQDIESFARFRGALERQTSSPAHTSGKRPTSNTSRPSGR